MAKRNPAGFFMATWVPYLIASISLSGLVGVIDFEAALFALAAATSLSGLLTLVREVQLPTLVNREEIAQPAIA